MGSVNRCLHRPEDPVAVGASLETVLEAGAPSASSSLVEDTSVEESPPRPSHPANGIGVLPISGAANASILKTPEAAREGMPGDKTLLWDSTMDGGTGMRQSPFMGTNGRVSGLPGSVRPEIERLGALGRLAQQREQERVTQNELDRVARKQWKVEEDDWTRRLQYLKYQAEVEEQRTRTLHTNCQDLQAECDRLRAQRDGEQQLLASDRAQGDRLIADRVSKLRGINDLIFASTEKQRELETIEEVSERSKGSDETEEVNEVSPVHGGGARDKSNVSSPVSTSTKVPTAAESLAKPVGNVPELAFRQVAPSVMKSFTGSDGAGPTGHRTRPSDDVRVTPVLPPPLPAVAYSVAVPRTVVPVTVPSLVVLTTALPITRPAVPMRVPAATVSCSSLANPMPAPVIQVVSSASAPSTQHLAASDADDQWDWGVSGANAGSARNTNWAVGTGARIPAWPAHYQPRVQTDWDAVGGGRHDSDQELDRGGGVRDRTTRRRNVEV